MLRRYKSIASSQFRAAWISGYLGQDDGATVRHQQVDDAVQHGRSKARRVIAKIVVAPDMITGPIERLEAAVVDDPE